MSQTPYFKILSLLKEIDLPSRLYVPVLESKSDSNLKMHCGVASNPISISDDNLEDEAKRGIKFAIDAANASIRDGEIQSLCKAEIIWRNILDEETNLPSNFGRFIIYMVTQPQATQPDPIKSNPTNP